MKKWSQYVNRWEPNKKWKRKANKISDRQHRYGSECLIVERVLIYDKKYKKHKRNVETPFTINIYINILLIIIFLLWLMLWRTPLIDIILVKHATNKWFINRTYQGKKT